MWLQQPLMRSTSDSWSITAGAQAIRVEIPGVIVIDDPLVVYTAVYWLQPEEPVTVPSVLKRAVTGCSPITLAIPPFPSVYENSRQFTPVGNDDEPVAPVAADPRSEFLLVPRLLLVPVSPADL